MRMVGEKEDRQNPFTEKNPAKNQNLWFDVVVLAQGGTRADETCATLATAQYFSNIQFFL